MRVAYLPLFVLPLLLNECGSGQDLIIGEVLVKAEPGTAGASGAGAGVQPTAGALAVAGAGGTDGVGGVDTAGATSMAGSGEENCVDGEEPPLDSLLHRYSFDGSGATAVDTIAGADGDVVGTTLTGNGAVAMDGKSRQYVDLPNGIVSSLTDVTVVVWLTWTGGAAYQRVFDFGISSSGEGLGDSGTRYLAVLPMTGFQDQAKPGLGAEVKAPGFPTIQLASVEDMKNRAAQVSFVFRGGVSAKLYLDANLLASEATAITLADIDDRNDWLGQSQYQGDPFYQGSYEEFRIYGAALDACQLHTLLVRGPQAP